MKKALNLFGKFMLWLAVTLLCLACTLAVAVLVAPQVLGVQIPGVPSFACIFRRYPPHSRSISSTISSAEVISAALLVRIRLLHPSEYLSLMRPGKETTSRL